jgi:uncharacterized membrane protein YuzA (DUF378 family)
MREDNPVGMTSLVLVIVGALNWGLVGVGGYLGSDLNLVSLLLGSVPVVENAVYVLVGLAGLYEVYNAAEQM